MAQLIRDGKAPGPVSLAKQLEATAAGACSNCVASKLEWADWREKTAAEWKTAVSALLEKFLTDPAQAFLEKYEAPVAQAVSAWNFKEVPWMAKDIEDSGRSAELAMMTRFCSGLEPAKRLLKGLAAISLRSEFQTEHEAIQKEWKCIDATEELASRTANTLASIVVATAIATDGSVQEGLLFASSKLGLSLQMLPESIQARVKQPAATPPHSVVSHAPSVGSSLSTAAEVSDACAQQPATKKARKFSKGIL